jgi:hypothetical protein
MEPLLAGVYFLRWPSKNGWAPGSVGDWENGSHGHGSFGWCMGLILGDTIIGLGWITLKPLLLRAWAAAAAYAYARRQAYESFAQKQWNTSLCYWMGGQVHHGEAEHSI